nr:hypothetical protein HmN_000532400 [Hymenolepis microstoma]
MKASIDCNLHGRGPNIQSASMTESKVRFKGAAGQIRSSNILASSLPNYLVVFISILTFISDCFSSVQVPLSRDHSPLTLLAVVNHHGRTFSFP